MFTKLVLAVALAAALVVFAGPAAPASVSTVVLGQVFAGGGNSGAPYLNDYVELFNRGSTAVDVTGWSLQYAGSSSTTWDATPLAGSIPAGGHYLVQLASGGSVGAALPAADATGTANLAMSGGKVALVSGTAALACGAAAGSCSAVSSVEDLLGYGTASDYEGSAAAPALTSTAAAVRGGGGCVDTGQNASDFATAAPAPHDAASPAAPCTTTPQAAGSAAVDVGLDLQPELSVTLDRSSVTFGSVLPGATPAPVPVAATVFSNDAAGYSLTVHRSVFSPADLPLAIAAAPGGPLVAIPVAPAADLQLAATSAPSAASGDVWPTSIGFSGPLTLLAPGHYGATVTYTVIGR